MKNYIKKYNFILTWGAIAPVDELIAAVKFLESKTLNIESILLFNDNEIRLSELMDIIEAAFNLEYRKLTNYKKIFNILLSTHFIEFLKVNFKNIKIWVPDINEMYRDYKEGDDDPYINLTFGGNNG